jgi:hypothetical protein
MRRSALSLIASLSCVCVLGTGCGSMQSPGSDGVQRRTQQFHSERIPNQAEAGSRLRLRSEELQSPARDHQSVLPDGSGDPAALEGSTPSTKTTAAELSGRSISQSVT